MKKFFYVALMILTMGLMVGCAGSSSKYTKGGPEPVIDTNAATVNGVHYDDTTAKCWKVTETYRAPIVGNVTETNHQWCTEFALVAELEELMYYWAQVGYGNASYSYVVDPASDYESCYAKDE